MDLNSRLRQFENGGINGFLLDKVHKNLLFYG